MFDVGALELVVIAVVALLVVGPERLPRLARTAGRWVGRGRRALLSVKDEIDREIKAEELREIIRRQNERKPLDEILEEQFDPKTAAKGQALTGGKRLQTNAKSDAESGAESGQEPHA
ncbi:Sec-independent protein translocase protein TatB [Thiorhodovibrio frisius]|uniref:Sec-independent protein translocase protein TatB n=1 Tax=Thiorhodovibrio frisius TaxID=631362 RepID=H8Z150_9GAMM|nr:Sec-independent protein translocase protein TatB [Thiorhodovibrio frisius]EIC21365.1 twin arginine-targeting protein translocase TatB [Thiorhodovibrio frisius]WPL23951.1 Sec-independent protein translocase protein TatB [Thiorhodovibrio frisius]